MLKRWLRAWFGITETDRRLAEIRSDIEAFSKQLEAFSKQPQASSQDMKHWLSAHAPITWSAWRRQQEARLEQKRRASKVGTPVQKEAE